MLGTMLGRGVKMVNKMGMVHVLMMPSAGVYIK